MTGHLAGVLASVSAIAAATGLVYALRPVAPILSLGVVYVAAVVAIAVTHGIAYAVLTSIGATLAFNFLFLPPVHSFTLRDSENWVALAAYLTTAVVVGELAAGSRRRAEEAEQRRREAAFLAETSALLLETPSVHTALKDVAHGVGDLLSLAHARIELGSVRRAESDEVAYDLVVRDRHVGRLFADADTADRAAVARVLPPLASLLAVADDRERFAHTAVEAETLRRSDAIKTAVLRSVSHDLRSPLTAIRAAADGLGLDVDPSDRRDLLDAIKLEVRRLERLVTNLIDLSRLETGAAQPHAEVWTVDELVARALDVVDAGDDRVVVRLPDEPLAMRVDAAHVERALVNLIENALKFSVEPIEVRVHGTGDAVLMDVHDRGPGLGPGEAARVFEPFALGRSGRTSGGTGLGLAIARGFAQANGGDVTAAPGKGAGAVFTLSLPRAHVPAEVRS